MCKISSLPFTFITLSVEFLLRLFIVHATLFFFFFYLYIYSTFCSIQNPILLPLFLTFLKQIACDHNLRHECLFSSECFCKFTLTRLDYRHGFACYLKPHCGYTNLSICCKKPRLNTRFSSRAIFRWK